MKVHLVIGETGEYSDYRTWIVVGSMDHNHACLHADYLGALAAEQGVPDDIHKNCLLKAIPDSPEDPGLKENWMGYGVTYSVKTVDLLDND